MSGHRWTKFWWDDWIGDPALSQVSLDAQGLWMRLLCLMAKQDPPGRLEVDQDLAVSRVNHRKLLGVTRERAGRLIAQLVGANVCSLEHGFLISRRMVRDWKKTQDGQEAARKRWPEKSPSEPIRTPNGQPNGTEGSDPLGHPLGDLMLEAKKLEAKKERGGTPYPTPNGAGKHPAADAAGTPQTTSTSSNFPPPGRRRDGTNPRAEGTDLRAQGANPRALATNPRAIGDPRATGPPRPSFSNPMFEIAARQATEDADHDDDDDED